MSGFQHTLAPIASHAFPQPISALAFDPVSDVLWAGAGSGYVSAHYGTQGVRGVCFKVGENPVQKVVPDENSVKAATGGRNSVGSWAKGGHNKWYYNSNDSITTFASSSTSPVVAASTVSTELLLLNAMTGSVVRQAQTSSMVTHLEFSHSLLLSGAADGYLRMHDPRTGLIRNGGSESLVKAHYGGIQGLQTIGNFVFTIGMSLRQSRPFPDPLVKVYDLRSLRALPPIPFSSSPAFINVLPKRSSSIVITSNEGLINIVDATDLGSASEFYQLENVSSYITSVAVSPTGTYLACGDTEGLIHMKSQVEGEELVPLNGFEGRPVEWADPPPPLPEIQWTDSTPLNSIGLPHYKTQLLSAWSPQFMSSSSVNYPPPQKIPAQVLSTMKMNDNIAYAALPKELKGRRNMVVLGPKKGGARFRSGKSRTSEAEPETPVDHSGEEVPKLYRHVEIEYSKFGVEDFDFGFYNKTEFSGLETHILNSYTNPILQVMHYCLPIRRLAKSHITTDCPREHCLLCELGFVVRMLEDAKGTNCQSSNFCKTVGVLAQTFNALDLIDYGRGATKIDYAHMIQSFHRFLIDHLSSEGNIFPDNPVIVKDSSFNFHPHNPAPAPITQLMGIDAKNVITCLSCKAVREKENMSHIVDMVYPRKVLSNDIVPSDFSNILRNSLLRVMTHKATCQSCGRHFSNFSSRRSIATRDLPPILAVNACINTEDNLKHWSDVRNQTFLKPRIELHGQVNEMDDPEGAIYELRAVIAQIRNSDENAHLVAIVKVPEAESGEDGKRSPWYIFNDFAVQNVPEMEALSFPGKWKIPAVLHFERIDKLQSLDFSALPDEIDSTTLSRDTSISVNRDPALIKHECLSHDELPKPGTLVAIDAEFVSMQQEETEFRSDGTKKVIRPARLSLARVSCLRGNGPKEGLPFIDDHIHTSEVIVDYVTEFSGIKFGDLDPMRSPYTLTPLKLVYKKLRLLVDRGCIFIGHGLSKDFRIINIFVPPEQVIDTVDLYYINARQRRLSLRFLSWFVLHEQIQTDMHDSIEDARCALNLYKAYHEFEEQGIFDQKLEELYKEGRQYNYKPPPPPDSTPRIAQERQDTPPVPFNLDRTNVIINPYVRSYPSSQSSTPAPIPFRPFTPRGTQQ